MNGQTNQSTEPDIQETVYTQSNRIYEKLTFNIAIGFYSINLLMI